MERILDQIEDALTKYSSYRYIVKESSSIVNLFTSANVLTADGWHAYRFDVFVSGWLFKSYTYRIAFRKRLPPPRPGAINIRVAAEDRYMLQFFVGLPAKTEAEFDVVSRKLEIDIGGTALEPQTVPVETLEAGPFEGPQDAAVKIHCWNVDDAGNVSETASEFEGVLLDTFAPPAPGQLGIRVTGETPDIVPPPVDPPVEEPTPEEPVPEEPVEDETVG